MAVLTYKCPNCDAPLSYLPERGAFGCEYCGSTFTEEEVRALTPDAQTEEAAPLFEEEAAQAPETAQAVLYTCPSCGAEVVTDADTAATFCFYCHNPVVLSGRLSGEYLPDSVIPFALDREEAEKRFRSWLKTKRYLPRDFLSSGQIEKLTGVYFPYWVADCEVDALMHAEGHVLRIWRAGNIEYTETKNYAVERRADIAFRDLTRLAMEREDKKLVEGVLPFTLTERRPFHMGYLSGFLAEKRSLTQEEVAPVIEGDLYKYSEELLRETVTGYASVGDVRTGVVTENARYHYTLLPVWALTYQSGGQTYYCAMNGQTGKTCGVLPVDKSRLLAHAAAIAGALGTLLMLGGYFLL